MGINVINVSEVANGSLSHLDPTKLAVAFDSFDNDRTVNTFPLSILTRAGDGSALVESFTKTVSPGQEFILSLGAFDRLHNSVPLTVFSQLAVQNESVAFSTIGASNRFLLEGGRSSSLSNVTIRIFGAEDTNYTMTITSNEAILMQDFTIFVTMSNCSRGFQYNEDTLRCECEIDKYLEGVTCNDNGTVSYEAENWIGLDENENYIQAPCILDFCEPRISVISLSDPNVQCRNNRSGILCGQCLPGHSRIIGATFCDLCESNNFLALIILFAALGILLFIILAVFNITITDGFINGFIFYSNIIGVYTATFLPVTELRGTPPQVLISFLNLNFGIKSCFFVGATELDLTGLTLLFPVYLMLILLAIILFGKYVTHRLVSSFFKKIYITHIFATLLLYAYASIMESCISILASLYVENASPDFRWSRDPNVAYNSELHLFLVILCGVFFALLFPLPIILLIPNISFRIPYVKDLKPLIDAFIAPFAPGRAFWLSFRLLFRLVIYIIAAAGVSTTQLVIMSLLISSVSLLQAYIKPFKSSSRNIIDILLMFNLMLFSVMAVFLFAKNLDDEQQVMEIMIIFTYIFSIMLISLFIHYLLKRFDITRIPYEKAITWTTKQLQNISEYILDPTKCCSNIKKKKLGAGYLNSDLSTTDSGIDNIVTHTSVALRSTEVSFIGLREALLEDDEWDSARTSNSSASSKNSRESTT